MITDKDIYELMTLARAKWELYDAYNNEASFFSYQWGEYV